MQFVAEMISFFQLSIIITLLLVFATIFLQYQIAQGSNPERLKNRQRLFVWWIIFVLCICVFQLGIATICIFICLLFIWSLCEIHSLFEIDFNHAISVILSSIIFLIGFLVISYPQFGNIVLLCAVLSVFSVSFLNIKSGLYFLSICLYCAFSLSSIVLVSVLIKLQALDYSYFLLVLFFITAVNDISQYVAGSLLGKTAIAPVLSSKKTVAGLWGGILISSALSVLLLRPIFSMTILESFMIGSLIALSGFCGDLLISKLKRGLRLKDTANTIIGHGGILDRIDSLLLVAPVLTIVLRLRGYL